MIDLMDATIEEAIIHRVGNKSRNEDLHLSEKSLKPDAELESALLKYFFHPFYKDNTVHEFFHEEDISLNEMLKHIDNMQSGDLSFLSGSKKISKLLYRITTHPNILTGELFISVINGVKFKSRKRKILGIFKSERKSNFIELDSDPKNIKANVVTGLDLENLDKGALIFLDSKKPTLLVYNSRGIDSHYWNNSFLGCRPINDDDLKTKHCLDACLNFTKKIADQFESKNDVIKFNNKFTEYFQEAGNFDPSEFAQRTGLNNEQEQALYSHLDNYQNNHAINFKNGFKISEDRLKKLDKRLQSTIKLDTHIELKIDIKSQLPEKNIEKGFDKKRNMHFYKIYFNEELN
ncbi:MAG: hypothetical protein CML06_00990 [Pseudomonadales bacterium]|nr:hypothetical protein [Pseudomonadales bacterium]